MDTLYLRTSYFLDFLILLLGFSLCVESLFFWKASPFSVKDEVFGTQNKALGHIVRGQLLDKELWLQHSFIFSEQLMTIISASIFYSVLLLALSVLVLSVSFFFRDRFISSEKWFLLKKKLLSDNNGSSWINHRRISHRYCSHTQCFSLLILIRYSPLIPPRLRGEVNDGEQGELSK